MVQLDTQSNTDSIREDIFFLNKTINGELYGTYEPIVDQNRFIYSEEILCRLNGGGDHIAMLNTARKNNRSFTVFKKIFKNASTYSAQTNNLVNVNIEIQDILSEGIIGFLNNEVNNSGLNPNFINLELLEYEKVDERDKNKFFGKIKKIQSLGFGIVIDDIFSGHSDKERLDSLMSNGIDISQVKVDGKYLQKLFNFYSFNKDSGEYLKLKNFIKELQGKGIRVVAEWVSDDNIFQFAKGLGFDLFQGYLFTNRQNVASILDDKMLEAV